MAFKIPDFTAVGFDDPRAVGGLPNYPKTDPGAEGLAALGKGVQAAGGAVLGIADDRQTKRDKLNESTATLDLFTRLVPLQTKIAQETDTDKIAEYRTELNTLPQTSGQAIDNPDRRQAWMANHAKTILEANANADTRTTLLYRNKSTAASNELLDRVVQTGASSDDPMAFVVAQRGITEHLDWEEQNGNLLPQARYEKQKQMTKQHVEGRTLYLLGKDRPNEAKAFLDRHGGELDPITRGNFELRIDGKVETLGADAAANRALGLAPALPARKAGSMSVGGAISSAHINYGGTGALGDPNEAGWKEKNLTSARAPSGASFRVNNAAAADFTGFLKELEATGYKIDTHESGGHSHRNMKGGDTLSEHAYGTAIDINPSRNPYSKEGKKVTDLPDNVGEIAAKYNLAWGGNWTSPVDTMHFQWRGPGGVASAEAAPDRVDNWETRNNNFGGIRKKGVVASTAEGGFESYATPEQGVQAIADNLKRYAAGGVTTAMNPEGKPLNTLRGIVSTWAPPSENPTDTLIARAVKTTGFSTDQPLDLNNPATMAKVIEATIRNEQGGKLPISPAIITRVAGGAGSAPNAAPAGLAPPNRTGLPSLAEAERTIYSDPTLTTDRARALAFDRAKSKYNALEADAARAERIATEAQKATVNARITAIQQDAYSDQPTISARDIVNDPTFNSDPKMREHMIGFINNPPGSGIPAPQSYAAAQSIIDRLRLPEGDPNKITSRNQIYDMKDALNRADLEFSLKKFEELSSPGLHPFGHRLERFFQDHTPQIDRSGQVPELPSDGKGKAKSYEFRRFVEDQVDQYRNAKPPKNPDDLINPKKPDYLGSTETLKPYKRTIVQGIADFVDEMGIDDKGKTGADKAKSPAFDLTTADGIKAAYRAGHINREQALKASIDAGFSAPAAVSPPAAPQPPVPLAR